MKLIFGGIVAVILLGLYAYAVVTAILVVNCITTAGCSTLASAERRSKASISRSLLKNPSV
jgi:hypothetical protein